MKGIRKTAQGWQAYVHVAHRFYSKRFPPDATLTEMKYWREEQRVRVRLGAELPVSDSTFGEDVTHYLELVRSMPTFRWREDDLKRWVAALGAHRDRRSITRTDVRAQLEKWRVTYKPSTVNHRRTALMHLFSLLDGKSAPNPARDVPRYREEESPPHALSPQAIRLVLRAMPQSQTKARCTLMATTGWPHAQIMRLEPEDVDWDRAVYLRARRKGKGVEGRWLPLTPAGWKALRAFRKWDCWGPFSTSSMRRSFRLAATAVAKNQKVSKSIRAELGDVTPYDLRHSFATLVVLLTQDDRAAQELLLHADVRQTQRYTKAALSPRVMAAIGRLSGSKRAGNVPR